MKIHSEQEMLEFGQRIAAQLSDSPKTKVIELIGDVGAGKTTFVRGLARALGVATPVTSPSFTISKTYALKNHKTLIHYDFYRLLDPGLMQDDLAESLSNPNSIVVVEWGESIAHVLPNDRLVITIAYNDDNSRTVTINPALAK